jgi:hypothetical protein
MDVSKNTHGFRENVRLVFVSFGSRELGNNSFGGSNPFGGDPKENNAALKKAGINSAFYVSQNTAHEFLSWRRSLKEMGPLGF